MKIEIKPFSNNKMWKGRRFKTREYRDWRKWFGYICQKGKTITEPCHLEVVFSCSRANRSDLDNFLKPFLDALVESKVLSDDRIVQSISARKIKGEDYIEYEITPI